MVYCGTSNIDHDKPKARIDVIIKSSTKSTGRR